MSIQATRSVPFTQLTLNIPARPGSTDAATSKKIDISSTQKATEVFQKVDSDEASALQKKLVSLMKNLSTDKAVSSVIEDPLGNFKAKLNEASAKVRKESEKLEALGELMTNMSEEQMELKLAIARSKPLPGIQKIYDKISNSDPKAPIELDTEDADKIRKLAHQNGYITSFPGQDVVINLKDDNIYTFKLDGSVTVHEQNVPKSAKDKQDQLQYLGSKITEAKASIKGRSTDELVAALDESYKKYDAAKMEILAKYEETGNFVNKAS